MSKYLDIENEILKLNTRTHTRSRSPHRPFNCVEIVSRFLFLISSCFFWNSCISDSCASVFRVEILLKIFFQSDKLSSWASILLFIECLLHICDSEIRCETSCVKIDAFVYWIYCLIKEFFLSSVFRLFIRSWQFTTLFSFFSCHFFRTFFFLLKYHLNVLLITSLCLKCFSCTNVSKKFLSHCITSCAFIIFGIRIHLDGS